MVRFATTIGAVLLLASVGLGQFDVDFTNGLANGVVQFQSGNPDIPTMFNPGGGVNNSLQVLIEDGHYYGGQINKGGEPLGMTAIPANQSLSGYYKFSFSQLPATPSGNPAYTFAGFLGEGIADATRQALGSLLIHWQDGADYYVSTQGFFGGVGIGDAGGGPATTINLGPNALNTTYQLVLSWDAPSHTMRTALYDASNALLGQTVGNLDNAGDYPNLHNLPQANLDGDLAATNLKYLGWMDYTAYLNLQTVTWDVARLAAFDSARGAFSLVPEPTAALLLAGGLLLVRRRRA